MHDPPPQGLPIYRLTIGGNRAVPNRIQPAVPFGGDRYFPRYQTAPRYSTAPKYLAASHHRTTPRPKIPPPRWLTLPPADLRHPLPARPTRRLREMPHHPALCSVVFPSPVDHIGSMQYFKPVVENHGCVYRLRIENDCALVDYVRA